MNPPDPDTLTHNFTLFRDVFSTALIEKVSQSSHPISQRTSSNSTRAAAKAKKKAGTTHAHRRDTSSIQADHKASSLPDREVTSRGTNTSTSTTAATTATTAEDLAEFADYTASLAFDSLPEEVQTLTYQSWVEDAVYFGQRYHLVAAGGGQLNDEEESRAKTTTTTTTDNKQKNNAINKNKDSNSSEANPTIPLIDTEIDISDSPGLSTILSTLDPDVADSLLTYNFLLAPAQQSLPAFFTPILTTYFTTILITNNPTLATTTTTSSSASSTRTNPSPSCEICDRDWIPLTFHHLIPRAVHAKALKRNWHPAADLQNGAWLCRACHSFVHRFASNEELAREWYTVERLLEAEEVQRFAGWVCRIRWKAK